MKSLVLLFLSLVALPAIQLHGQNEIENVLVETYYISDANDATDTTGGALAIGSRTYRVFLDLCSDCSLRAIYGDEDHQLSISSTAVIFNNRDRGRVYGHDINHNALDENTAGLDSWLAMGAGSNQRAGIPKELDQDGSVIGGANNDGGSEMIPEGLLNNSDQTIGIPLIERDGLMPFDGVPALPPNFNMIGEDPSSVFGDSTAAYSFTSNDVRIGCSTPGVQGATPENLILIAQITTTGELTFKLNIEVERGDGSVVSFVSSDDVIHPGETPNGLLSYPPVCGCTDPNFLEYEASAGCDDGSCTTAIVYGCLDTLACNYSMDANFHVQELCCFGPDNCNGLDPSLICPGVGLSEYTSVSLFTIAPNPVADRFQLVIPAGVDVERYVITDRLGRAIVNGPLPEHGETSVWIDVTALDQALYLLHILGSDERYVLPLLKL